MRKGDGPSSNKQRRITEKKMMARSPLAASYATLLHETLRAKDFTINLLQNMLAAKNKTDP